MSAVFYSKCANSIAFHIMVLGCFTKKFSTKVMRYYLFLYFQGITYITYI